MRGLISGAVLIALAACATPYQANGLSGGFTDFSMGGNQHMIKVNGNGYTSSERATTIAYVRAADLAVSQGFTHFLILGFDESGRTYSQTTPGRATTSTFANAQTSGQATAFQYGNSATAFGTANTSMNATSTTTYTPPQTNYVFKPNTGMVVELISAEDPRVSNAIDAQGVLTSMGSKVGYKTE